MAIVLGIDAAWTLGQPSGIALVDCEARECLRVAPSYSSFLDRIDGGSLWEKKQSGGPPPAEQLLAVSREIAGRPVDVVTVDMPVATVPITGRRTADNAVSREFGGRWCAAHTPNPDRPGALGAGMSDAFGSLGYPLATADTPAGTPGRLIEVYPHPALLALLHRDRRVPYKVGKAARYWPQDSPATRVSRLLTEFRAIAAGLTAALGPMPFDLPRDTEDIRKARLKAYEDALDAMISAWVGALYLNGQATALGDETAAVWCPTDALQRRSDQR